MNAHLAILEIAVALLALGILAADLWTPEPLRRRLGYVAALGLGVILLGSYSAWVTADLPGRAFHEMYLQDAFSLFFKRFFLIAAILVLIMATEFADRFRSGHSEYVVLTLLALVGMMFTASANDLTLLFVSLELVTVSFFILTAFQRHRVVSLEAGVKYLIVGVLASTLLVFGIALVYGTAGSFNFDELNAVISQHANEPLCVLGVLLIVAGLAFKIAAFPFQVWTPDVYEGAPVPTTAFLAVGSKAAGFALLLRFLCSAVPDLSVHGARLIGGLAIVTILYGNLGAIPQRNLKRLLGYSSISNAGYLLLGIAALSNSGQAAVLFYLGTYLFSVLAALGVLCVAFRGDQPEDLAGLAGLHQRSPFLAATLTLAMVSLAGVPPLAGFFGKLLLLGAVIQRVPVDPIYPVLLGVTLLGVVISIYYYFGVIRAIFWSREPASTEPITVSLPMRLALGFCLVALLYLGLAPGNLVAFAAEAVSALSF